MKQITSHIKSILALTITLLSFTYFFVSQFSHTKPNDQILIAIVGLMGNVTGYYFLTHKKEETPPKQ